MSNPEDVHARFERLFARASLSADSHAELSVALAARSVPESYFPLTPPPEGPSHETVLNDLFSSLSLPPLDCEPPPEEREAPRGKFQPSPAVLRALLSQPSFPRETPVQTPAVKPQVPRAFRSPAVSTPATSSQGAPPQPGPSRQAQPPVISGRPLRGGRLSRLPVRSRVEAEPIDVDNDAALEHEIDFAESLQRDKATQQGLANGGSGRGAARFHRGHRSGRFDRSEQEARVEMERSGRPKGGSFVEDGEDSDDYPEQRRRPPLAREERPTRGGFRTASEKLALDRKKAGGAREGRKGGGYGDRPGSSFENRPHQGQGQGPTREDRGFDEEGENDGMDVARTVTRAVLGPAKRPRFSAPRSSAPKKKPRTTEEDDGVTRDDLPEIPNVEPRLVEMIMNEALDKSPGVDWDDIAGLHFAKKCVMEAVIYPMLRPDIFTGLRGPPKGLLLFGPPGTGKTVLAKTIASKAGGAKFFAISASSLMSKWVGEGEKMVRALFAVAREVQPSIIFIDEIDSLLTQRTDGDQESSRRVKTEFLVQMDGAATSREDRVLVIGATNRPAELDEAARRRMVKRLYIPLPDDEARLYLVKRLLLKQNHDLKDETFAVVTSLTKGYSGSDIYALCAEAALGPVRDLGSSIGTVDASSVRPISLTDFEMASKSVRASVAESDLVGYKEWNETFGSFDHKG